MSNSQPSIERRTAWFISIAGSFLILGGLAWLLFTLTAPPGIDQVRAEERRKALAEVRGADQQALTTAAVLDAGKGLYRIPIENAEALMLAKWQDPAAGRADLLRRLEVSTAQPPPPANPYE
ncbi:MAG: hypothetical protein KDM81_01995 [Verrucomicrobiae bacterium]|nr:hypothetical protein [Verrucomicrobiae bacterium]MCP5523188.1 hypothetical protein [Verrucomicrobiales bacterium]